MGGSWAMVPSLVVVVWLVVVDDLDGISGAITPDEAEAVLIIDPDAVLTAAISEEGFEAVPGRDSQIIEAGSHLKLEELAAGYPLEGDEPPDADTVGQGLGVRTAERSDHAAMVTRNVSISAIAARFGCLQRSQQHELLPAPAGADMA